MKLLELLAIILLVVGSVAVIMTVTGLRRRWVLKRARWEPSILPGESRHQVICQKKGEKPIPVGDPIPVDTPNLSSHLLNAEQEALAMCSTLNNSFKRLDG